MAMKSPVIYTVIKMNEILKIRNLKKYFHKKKILTKALDNVSLDLFEGETLGIVGESGSGKSTLARCILNLYNDVEGKIEFQGKDIKNLKNEELKKYRGQVQMIFQDPYSSLNPRRKTGQIVGEGLINIEKLRGKELKEKVLETMEICGLPKYTYERYPHEFSGGQRQRIGIARALAVNPKLIVADEPTSALDVSIQAHIINLLNQLKEKMSLSIIFISHDLAVVEHIADRIAVMYLGQIVEMAPTKELFENPMHPYTRVLLSAIPKQNPWDKSNEIKYRRENELNEELKEGCKYRDRCGGKKDSCENPYEMIEVKKDHFVSCKKYIKK